MSVPNLNLTRRLSGTSPLCRKCVEQLETPSDIFDVDEKLIKKDIQEFEKDGEKHKHDMSELIKTYRCDNGHEWEISISKNKCWCQYGSNKVLSSSPRFISHSPTTSPRSSLYKKSF